MSIVAALDKVLFFNASSKYSVLRMKTEDSSVPTEARSPYRYHDHLIRFTAVGIELPQTDTVKIEMDGEWKDGKYGLQLQVDHWQEIVPPTLEGVRNYLASGLLKGIGEKTADAIIEKFGGGPVGLDTLAASIGEDAGTIEDVYEPYLLMKGLIDRTPRGRVATQIAYTHLGL